MPEFNINFDKSYVIPISDWTVYKKDGQYANDFGDPYLANYYPGFTLKFKSIRDPFAKLIRLFFPCYILASF